MASLYAMSIPIMLASLSNLDHVLKKAEQWATENNVAHSKLIEGKLAPDMLPFTKQIYICTNASKFVLSRVAQQEVPVWEDNETTFDQLHARIEKTLALLRTAKEADFEGKENVSVKFTAGAHELNMTGLTYLQTWALPNFFFHVVTAYDILRNAGVPLGKQDFLAGARQSM